MKTSTKLVYAAIAASVGVADARLRSSAAVLAVDAKITTAGRSSCPCIGIEGLSGEVSLSHHNVSAKYPADVGSKCAAWDDGKDTKHCSGDNKAPWCAHKWCYVDPCNCDSSAMKSPPHPSHMLSNSASRAMPLYYSYATCESEDAYTAKENTHACPSAKTEEACDEAGCAWDNTEQWGEVCLGMEASGLCGENSNTKEWGEQDCPCVGFMGMTGSVQANMGNSARTAFPAEVGSACQAWDMERNPDCFGPEKSEGCDQKWCYVDATNCKGKMKRMSTYFVGAKTSGHALQYSYETCGSKAPKVPPQGTAHSAMHAKKPDADHLADEEEYPVRHDLPMAISKDNPTEVANAKKAAAKRAGQPHVQTPMEKAREEFAAKHPQQQSKVDHKAFEDDWHSEFSNGHVPTWSELHPKAAKVWKQGHQK